jgi:hypothetical protein
VDREIGFGCILVSYAQSIEVQDIVDIRTISTSNIFNELVDMTLLQISFSPGMRRSAVLMTFTSWKITWLAVSVYGTLVLCENSYRLSVNDNREKTKEKRSAENVSASISADRKSLDNDFLTDASSSITYTMRCIFVMGTPLPGV